MRLPGTALLTLLLLAAGCGPGDEGVLDVDATGTIGGVVYLDRDGDRGRPTELGRRFTNDVVALFL